MFDTRLFDIDGYLQRIGYTGTRACDLDTLSAIAVHHPAAIPFENLNPLIGWPVALDIASLQRKLIHQGRGGYCFEHNVLLGHALAALGFSVTGLAARVLWNHPPGTITPRSHMILRIDLDGQPYIADAGFGGLTLTGVLALVPHLEQATPHERFRLAPSGGDFVLEASVRGDWRPLYRFDLQPQQIVDYEVTSWYLSNHPRSAFVTNLMAARVVADRRYALRNGDLAVHHMSGATDRRAIVTADELRHVLEELFAIRVPAGPGVDAALARVTVVPA